MLKKKLGVEGIELDWSSLKRYHIYNFYKIPSTLIIPENCKKIGYSAFEGYERLEIVVIPKSVEEISSWAFYGCWADIILKKPENEFKCIATTAFDYCNGVEYVKEEVRE